MLTSISSALSAVTAAFKKLYVSANNTANANTEGFKKSRAVLNEGPQGGVIVTLSKDSSERLKYIDRMGNVKEGSNTDYAEEAVE